MNPEFQALLIQARVRHGGDTPGTVRALAKVLRLTPQRTSDALGGGRGHSLDVERCLRLALDGKHNPYDVLRKGGHQHEADLLEELLGPWVPVEDDRKALRAIAERLARRAETTEEAPHADATPPTVARPRRRRP